MGATLHCRGQPGCFVLPMASNTPEGPRAESDRRPQLARLAPGVSSILSLPRAAIPTEIGVGMAVAAIAVPGGLAMAQLMGLAPQYGLYACIVPALVYALIGPS